MRWLAILALAGCPAMTSGGGGGATTTPSSPGGGGGAPMAAPVNGRTHMPDLTGKTEDEAKATLAAAGIDGSLEVNNTPLECEGAAKVEGKVNCQNPAPGADVSVHGIINVAIYQNHNAFAGSLVRAQLDTVRGLSLDAAKAQLKKLGHDGEIHIEKQLNYSAKCGDKVCDVQPESGTGIHDPVTLVVNPSVSISAPPPD